MDVISLDASKETLEPVFSFIDLWNSDNEVISQLTSGSTGNPKEIKIEKWKMEVSAKMTGKFLNLNNCKSALLCMSTQYIGGKMMVVRALQFNLQLYVTNVTRNPLEKITKPIDFAAMVPLQVEHILRENPEKLNLIKYLIIGGAPVSNQLIEQLKQFNCNAYSTFGMTETVSHIALKELKHTSAPFRAIGHTKLTTKEGRLVITNDELGLNNLETNDIVELINETSFHWLGRSDFVINSGGVKIHPEKIEEKIAETICSSNFIISSIPDDKLGNKVVFIGGDELKSADLKEKINNLITPYARPKEYFFLSSLHKTPSGKIDRIKTTAAIQ
ncbi:AMP-dependent synthetase [Brumimicrobium salinarum]|uniref:AMP-dependent synthetase n=1 Tax=Brumimicrobium salinarum TaxID=2058658 RepID=A0A2I0R3F7_9FLAO|nr:AMP-binding protein [Brumimicrobium salinarum]PKR80940.1 AMP-dependent synthetase [Brumimicrobium salinarum]